MFPTLIPNPSSKLKYRPFLEIVHFMCCAENGRLKVTLAGENDLEPEIMKVVGPDKHEQTLLLLFCHIYIPSAHSRKYPLFWLVSYLF